MILDRIYSVNDTKTYKFHAPTIVTSTPCRIETEMRYSLSKITIFEKITPDALHFLIAICNVCPQVIPKCFSNKIGLRLLETHSLKFISYVLKIYCLEFSTVAALPNMFSHWLKKENKRCLCVKIIPCFYGEGSETIGLVLISKMSTHIQLSHFFSI